MPLMKEQSFERPCPHDFATLREDIEACTEPLCCHLLPEPIQRELSVRLRLLRAEQASSWERRFWFRE